MMQRHIQKDKIPSELSASYSLVLGIFLINALLKFVVLHFKD